jgi:trimeric autotransporter adhesin
MKKLMVAGFLLAGIFGANAQTITVTAAGSVVSNTNDLSNSVRVGATAGNGALSTGGNNCFVGFASGKVNTSGNTNTFFGSSTGTLNTTGSRNTFIGSNSGSSNTTSTFNTFLGGYSGNRNTTGNTNTFLGASSGFNNIVGNSNTFVGSGSGFNNIANQNSFFGAQSGYSNTTGIFNTFIGLSAGTSNITGLLNVYVGDNSGSNATGSSNVFLGSNAGYNSLGSNNVLLGTSCGYSAGSRNVFIGNQAGYYETQSDKLYIANSNTSSPLLLGDFATSQLKLHGKVGIGGNSTTAFGAIPFQIIATPSNISIANYTLFVKGGILTEEMRVSLSSTWADYVFAKDYNLKPLSEVEQFIIKNKHLPNVPSAAQVKEEGINVGEMAKIQQEKIEELTLYIIAQNKRIEALEAKMNTN